MGRYAEIWGDVGSSAPCLLQVHRRCEVRWGDIGRHGEIWGDMGRYRKQRAMFLVDGLVKWGDSEG